ncbi:XrtA/PEP-CTERM system histidine kinase PrsK [Thauera sinica]|uniref:histidine kinase n=1 Tax=Thauera sinica TaxID=2665146 RepID=A0ABW1ALA7_9RHOO|nr:XrtA/PEP-CTERM system histidine kinase PrsK [Thauera sp. K11]ATE59088.1 PEP-CTERM system histidine kinase PrsK [Thauera sp. K11]
MLEVAYWGYGLAAVAYLIFGVYAFLAWRGGAAGAALLGAIATSCLWALTAAAYARTADPMLIGLSALLDAVRTGAWYAFLIILLRTISDRPARWPAMVAALIVAAQLVSLGLEAVGAGSPMSDLIPLRPVFGAWLAQAVFGLMLVEQLYRGVPAASRWAIKPLCIALGAGYIFDLYLFADGSLFGQVDEDVWAMRGVANALLLPLIAMSGARNPSWTLRMSMSREMVFHSTALAVSGLYLLVISAVGYYVRYFGGDWGRALQLTLLFAGLVLLGMLLFSGSQRARLRVFINKHLFPYRYDYRNEWLRFTQALASAGGGLDLGQSVIKALADLVESPAGSVWLRNADGRFSMHARLNQPSSDVSEPADSPLCRFLDEQEWIINLEEYRLSPAQYGTLRLPEWLSVLQGAWLVVPLKGSGALIGFVVLNAPRVPFEIDWEVLDLLKTAQRQAAGYLERMQAAEALLEARKFDSFNRMSAFVVHDLKNLVAQLSLMLKNAERHKHNPEFQQDMLETVAHAEARMRGLMSQLQEKRSIDPPRLVDLVEIARGVCRSKRGQRPEITLLDEIEQPVEVLAHPERLERIIGHVVQNALDATDDDGIVTIRVADGDSGRVRLTVEDTGCGMAPDFLRERLSRPFQTTKTSGMGIGVFETRQYVNEIGGALRFDSEVGRGTLVTVDLPRGNRGNARQVPEMEPVNG